jgi:hypothetical protein
LFASVYILWAGGWVGGWVVFMWVWCM